jgi:DNA ligase 1
MAALDFQFDEGAVHFPALGLWLDAHRPIGPDETVFVSHAHSDHTAAHARVILSPPTRSLMRARIGGERVERVLEFGQRVPAVDLGIRLPDGHLTLLPAGHILGSAMLLLEGDGTSLLYTGDFKLRPGLSAEACEPRHAEILVMETTFGRPQYAFPATAEIVAGVVRFCREALDNDETPVLLGYSLGKSQEILTALVGAGLPIALSDPVAKLTAVYESLGRTFPTYETLNFKTAAGKVVLAPPGMAVANLRRKLGPSRVAVLTGWAVDPGCRYQYQADAAFPLSDHADFPDLVEFVRRVAPRQVYTLHGFAADFAGHLRTLGFQARALSQTEQLELMLGASPTPVPTGRGTANLRNAPAVLAGGSEDLAPTFRAFASTCATIGTERAKSEKVKQLAAFLAGVDPGVLGQVTSWLTDAGPSGAAGQSLAVGWAILRGAICEVAGVSEAVFRNCYLKHSDTGETAAELLQDHAPVADQSLSLEEVASLFEALATARGPTQKQPLLVRSLTRCSPVEARFLVKILTGNLRIGLKQGLVEDALALAFHTDAGAVRAAHQVVGHLGDVALLARSGRLAEAGLIPFRPVNVMLASPEPDAAALWMRVAEWSPGDAPASAWIEDKYDGIRCQLHKVGNRVALYSRDLKDITTTFTEVAEAAASMTADAVLDGELVAMEGGRVLPFADLQRRLGRRQRDLFLESDIPVRFIAFDLLWYDGRSRFGIPLGQRRAELAALKLPAMISLATGGMIRDVAEIDAAFDAARARGNEGLMIKDPASAYLPGRRGLAWFKLKRALATLDCVVVAAEYGHGRRKAVLSDYTFAVRDERSGELRTIGKAYSGLTDVEIARLTEHFLARVVRKRGRVLEVTPDLVLEIAFDAIQESDRHDSGLALRFPRIARIRDDKTPAEIDTLATARRLAGLD